MRTHSPDERTALRLLRTNMGLRPTTERRQHLEHSGAAELLTDAARTTMNRHR